MNFMGLVDNLMAYVEHVNGHTRLCPPGFAVKAAASSADNWLDSSGVQGTSMRAEPGQSGRINTLKYN